MKSLKQIISNLKCAVEWHSLEFVITGPCNEALYQCKNPECGKLVRGKANQGRGFSEAHTCVNCGGQYRFLKADGFCNVCHIPDKNQGGGL